MLQILEHASSSYGPRTRHNANLADLTIAIAIDFTTAGERLTKAAAGKRFISSAITADPLVVARLLYRRLRAARGRTLNIAGNGIYTLAQHGWTQEWVNEFVYQVLLPVHTYWPLEGVVCGGQTGVDLAGAISAVALGIDTVVTMPKGRLQRGIDKVDRCNSEDEMVKQVTAGVESLARFGKAQ